MLAITLPFLYNSSSNIHLLYCYTTRALWWQWLLYWSGEVTAAGSLTLHVNMAKETRKIQSSDWPKWCCALWHNIISCLLLDKNIISDDPTNRLSILQFYVYAIPKVLYYSYSIFSIDNLQKPQGRRDQTGADLQSPGEEVSTHLHFCVCEKAMSANSSSSTHKCWEWVYSCHFVGQLLYGM